MARMIDADALLETASGVTMIIPKNCHPYEAIRIQGKAFKEAVEKAPTVDAVEVVRCHDCVGREFWITDNNDFTKCSLSGLYVRSENDFCPYGERKDGDK